MRRSTRHRSTAARSRATAWPSRAAARRVRCAAGDRRALDTGRRARSVLVAGRADDSLLAHRQRWRHGHLHRVARAPRRCVRLGEPVRRVHTSSDESKHFDLDRPALTLIVCRFRSRRRRRRLHDDARLGRASRAAPQLDARHRRGRQLRAVDPELATMARRCTRIGRPRARSPAAGARDALRHVEPLRGCGHSGLLAELRLRRRRSVARCHERRAGVLTRADRHRRRRHRVHDDSSSAQFGSAAPVPGVNTVGMRTAIRGCRRTGAGCTLVEPRGPYDLYLATAVRTRASWDFSPMDRGSLRARRSRCRARLRGRD